MRRICCFLGIVLLALGVHAKNNGTEKRLPIVTEICVANIDQTIDHSNNYGGWIELYNPSAADIPLDGWYVSDDAAALMKHRLSGCGRLKPGCYGCIFFGHNAADGQYGPDAARQVAFKLKREGGTLYLSRDGARADLSITYPESVPRCSYARTGLAADDWQYCGQPTPGAANAGHYAETMLDAPVMDCDSRLFTAAFTVSTAVPKGTTLRYTTDGSTPTLTNGKTSTDGRFRISATTVLRLRLFAEGFLPSAVVTRTFIYRDREYYLPIVAVTADPRNLYDDWIGCYVNGKNGVTGRGSKAESNLNMDWERPVNFEYLTADGRMAANQEASFEVTGGYSRHFEPASFKLQARKLYDGNGSFNFPLFAAKPHCKYKQLIIRNGGNNNRTDGGPRIKDAVTQQVLTSSGYYVDAQEYQPVHVFLNGKYLAMMNVREPNNRFHGSANYGYDDDETDGFEYSNGAYRQRGGSREAFDRLVALSEKAETDKGFAEVCTLLDMEEFVRYMAAICYTGSYDWLLNHNNVKGYRSQKDGKFHFVFFDQDLTWERTNNVEAIDGVRTNEVLTLYNNLRRNPAFCRRFVASYCILHGSVYTPQRCQAVADSICALIEKALSFDRRYTGQTYRKLQKEMWGESYRQARIQSLQKAYRLGEGMEVAISTNLAKASIRLEGQDLPFNRFSGTLFGSPELEAAGAEGYGFLGWKNQHGQWVSRERVCTVTKPGTYTAVFDQTFKEGVSPLCFNEISAHNDIFVNDYGKRADWIELYNRGREPLDAARYFFGEGEAANTAYRIDAAPGVNTVIQPNGRLVVWCDGRPSVSQPHLPFKLKNDDGSTLFLQSPDGRWKDSVRYDKHSAKESVGRYADGGDALRVFYLPSIGTRNMATAYDSIISDSPNEINPPTLSEEIAYVSYYTLSGIRTLKPANGIFIKVVHYKNGRTRQSKVCIGKLER